MNQAEVLEAVLTKALLEYPKLVPALLRDPKLEILNTCTKYSFHRHCSDCEFCMEFTECSDCSQFVSRKD